MRQLFLTISAISLLTAATPAVASDPHALAKTLYYRMESLQGSNASQKLVKEALQPFSNYQCFDQMQPELESMILKYAQPEGAEKLAIDTYATHFSAQELEEIIAFSHTAGGEAFFRKMPDVAAKAAKLAMEHYRANMGQITQQTMDIIQKYKDKDCSK